MQQLLMVFDNNEQLKDKKKGNRKLGLSAKFYNKEDKQKYSKGWDRIFGGNNHKDYNRKKT